LWYEAPYMLPANGRQHVRYEAPCSIQLVVWSTLYVACRWQATYKVLHTTSCILQSSAPEDGHNYWSKHAELILEF